jgi:hypothetical protein
LKGSERNMTRTTRRALTPDHPVVARLSVAIADMLSAMMEGSSSEAASDELVAISSMGEAQRDLRRRIHAGTLPAVKLGRSWFVKRSDLAALATTQTVEPVPANDATPEAAYRRLVLARRTA